MGNIGIGKSNLRRLPIVVVGLALAVTAWYELCFADVGVVQRSPASPRVGLQVGHWQNQDVPEELANLRRSNRGAEGGGANERDTMRVIAARAADMLQARDVDVDILPTTVPPGYRADAFVSLHVDQNDDPRVAGFKIAGSSWDVSGRSGHIEECLYEAYEAATSLSRDGTITENMLLYYAFNWPEFEHAIDPTTPAAIVETGFLTNPGDRQLIVHEPDVVAEGIVNGILCFLESGGRLLREDSVNHS